MAGKRDGAHKRLTRNEVWPIAVNVAKLPELMSKLR